jgi:hypothetical protein
LDKDLLARGEKPAVYLEFPVDISDFELVDLFNWQDEAQRMISQMEFVRMVDVQAETVERYIRDGRIVPDLEVPIGSNRSFKYFKDETVKKYAVAFGWDLITAANMKSKFIEMVNTMDMSYSYKPVLLKAMLNHVDDEGRVLVDDIVDYFIDFYESRKLEGQIVEKKNSIYIKDSYSKKDVERNIFANPFKRFEDMRFMKRSKDLEYVEFNRHVYKTLSKDEQARIIKHCDNKLKEYYERISTRNS